MKHPRFGFFRKNIIICTSKKTQSYPCWMELPPPPAVGLQTQTSRSSTKGMLRCSQCGRRGDGAVQACRSPLALCGPQMTLTSDAAWSKSRWVSVEPCLDAWLYDIKWPTATVHTSLRCTPTSVSESRPLMNKQTRAALCGEPRRETEIKETLEALPSQGDYINTYRGDREAVNVVVRRWRSNCIWTLSPLLIIDVVYFPALGFPRRIPPVSILREILFFVFLFICQELSRSRRLLSGLSLDFSF